MAFKTRSVVFALKAETTEGTLVAPSATTDFMTLRSGFSFSTAVDTISTDELLNNLGASEGFVGKQKPSGSIPKYFKHSGVEGQAPDYHLFLKAAFGTETVASTEYDTTSSSTAGTSAAAAVLKMESNAGAHFAAGQAVLIKDGTNGYSIRNVKSISTDDLTLNFNLSNAPATGIGTGKAILYSPAVTGHISLSAHLYQATSGAATHQAMTGVRTTSMALAFPANQLATATFGFEGIAAFLNPQVVSSSNCKIDFDIGGSELHASLTNQSWQDPVQLAAEVAAKMTAAASATISCSYSNSTGKYTISKATGSLTLKWNTGANTANTAAALLGFSAAADSSSAITYTSPTALSYDPSYTPAFDSSSANVVRSNELMIGDFTRNDNRQGENVSFTISTPKADIEDFTAATGISESVVDSRVCTMTATLLLKQHEVASFDNMVHNNGVSVMWNHGPKVAGNWVAGKCVNVCFPNAKITKSTIADHNGYQVVEIEAKAYVSATEQDCYINFV